MNRAAVVQTKMLTLPARKHVRLSGRDSLMQRMDDDADAGDDDDDDKYIMMQCLCVTKNEHFPLSS